MPPVMSHQDSRARAERAHRLRAMGRTWQEVADSEGYRSRGAARTAVTKMLAAEPGDSVDEVRRSASETLRITRSVLIGRFADAAQRRDDDTLVKMGREIHRNLAQWTTLVGANAPDRVDVHVQSATAILDKAEADLLALAASRPTPTTIEGEVI